MQIFQGKTISPIREYIADIIKSSEPKRIIMPCAGSFSVCFILPEELKKITYTSDINLYSSIIGYNADNSVNSVVEKLGIEIDSDSKEEKDILAECFYLMKLDQIKPSNSYNINLRKSMKLDKENIIANIKEDLKSTKERLSGINYNIQDFRDVAKDLKKGDFLFVNPPTYSGGYEKMFSYDSIKWNVPTIDFFNDNEYEELVEKMFNSEATVLVYSQHKVKYPNAYVVFAQYMGKGRTDYLISNRRLKPYSKSENKQGDVRIYPIYNEEEITKESKVNIIEVNRDTCMYYRDLFVHKLGSTKAECYYLMLIDGKVVTAFGLHRRDFFSMKSNYIGEVFGISISSKKYKRLGKLFMLCLTSDSLSNIY